MELRTKPVDIPLSRKPSGEADATNANSSGQSPRKCPYCQPGQSCNHCGSQVNAGLNKGGGLVTK